MRNADRERALDASLAMSLGPDGVETFLELAVWALLGRPLDDGLREAATAALTNGGMSRHTVLRNLVDSIEFAELAVVEELTLEALSSGLPFWPTTPVGAGLSERVVEVPWVLSRYRGESRVVDVGYANAPSAYLSLLLRIGAPRLLGLDLAVRRVPGLPGVQGDLRAVPIRPGSVDLMLLISTLEHVGFDNAVYGGPSESRAGDALALASIAEALRPGGRLLVSVPIGAYEDHGWFRQYDEASWRTLVNSVPFTPTTEDVFKATPDGWIRADSAAEVAGASYGSVGAGAAAVLCAELTRI